MPINHHFCGLQPRVLKRTWSGGRRRVFKYWQLKQSSPGYKVPVKHWGHGDVRDICGQIQGNILTRSHSSTGETPLRSDIAQAAGDDLVLSVAVASQVIVNSNGNAAYQLRASSAPRTSPSPRSPLVSFGSRVSPPQSHSYHAILYYVCTARTMVWSYPTCLFTCLLSTFSGLEHELLKGRNSDPLCLQSLNSSGTTSMHGGWTSKQMNSRHSTRNSKKLSST